VAATVPRAGDAYAWDALDRALVADRQTHPDDRAVVLVTADGVAYGRAIAALDRAAAAGYDQPAVGGQ
jgi:hypothetical protein